MSNFCQSCIKGFSRDCKEKWRREGILKDSLGEFEGQKEEDPVADTEGGSSEGQHRETAVPTCHNSETESRVV